MVPPGLHVHVPGILPLGQKTSAQMGGRARGTVAGAAEARRTDARSESAKVARMIQLGNPASRWGAFIPQHDKQFQPPESWQEGYDGC